MHTSVPGGGKSRCKDPEVGPCMACLKSDHTGSRRKQGDLKPCCIDTVRSDGDWDQYSAWSWPDFGKIFEAEPVDVWFTHEL